MITKEYVIKGVQYMVENLPLELKFKPIINKPGKILIFGNEPGLLTLEVSKELAQQIIIKCGNIEKTCNDNNFLLHIIIKRGSITEIYSNNIYHNHFIKINKNIKFTKERVNDEINIFINSEINNKINKETNNNISDSVKSNIITNQTNIITCSVENIVVENTVVENTVVENTVVENIVVEKQMEYQVENINLIDKSNNNKCAVIFFHKNIKNIYKEEWIDKCVKSVLSQTYKNYDILEINYGGDKYSVLDKFKEKINPKSNHYFINKKLDTHTEAMVYLLNLGFEHKNYDIIFNTNLDDYYREDRFEKQIECINLGFDMCSSMWNYLEVRPDNLESIGKTFKPYDFSLNKIIGTDYIDLLSIKKQLNLDNNVINHSGVCFGKKFWSSYDLNNNLLRYRDDKPFEDMSLWKRAINSNDVKITIIDENLITYRLHGNQIGSNKNKTNDKMDGGFKKSESLDIKRIGIFNVATGNYIQYIDKLVGVVEKNFLTEYKKVYLVSTDQVELATQIYSKHNVEFYINPIHKKGFPLDTLYRYKYLLNFYPKVETICDVIYYFDADMDIWDKVDSTVLPTREQPLVGTLHPGFYKKNKNGSPETNPKSTAYIEQSRYINKYIAGGFNGGITHYFIKMAEHIQSNINIDKSNDLIAVWHDESHLNRYHVYNSHMFKILNPDYCYPEGINEKLDCKPIIIALLKDHNKVRNLFTKKKIIINMLGGLGNLLYQVAFGLALSKKFDMELFVKDRQVSGNTIRASSYNYHLLDNIPKTKVKAKEVIYERKSFSIENIKPTDDLEFEGYFQNVNYFKEYFGDLIKLLDFEIDNIVLNIYEKILNRYPNKKLISLHIRGTDYIHNSHFYTILDDKYYSNCINKINNSDSMYFIFTDDFAHSSNILDKMGINSSSYVFIKNLIDEFLDMEYKYLLNNNSELELLLMSKFEILICTNSTFSMWGSYLSKATQIYVPSRWFEKTYFNQGNIFDINHFILNNNYIVVPN